MVSEVDVIQVAWFVSRLNASEEVLDGDAETERCDWVPLLETFFRVNEMFTMK